MTKEQEVVRSVFDAYIRDAKATSTKKDRPTFDMLEEVKNRAIKALEQQPSDDKVTITMNKGTLKYSGQGYVAYNKDWFRKHFATEVAIMTGYEGYKGQPTIEEILSHITTGITATGQSDSYCVGFCNALVWLKSCITHEEPQFFKDGRGKDND